MLKIVRIHFRKYPRLDPEKDVMKYDFAFLLVKLEIPQSFFSKHEFYSLLWTFYSFSFHLQRKSNDIYVINQVIKN